VVLACVNQTNGCFLTGDNEGIVKLWSKAKQLIFEFKLFEKPASGIFMGDDFGILIGHKSLVSEFPLEMVK